MRIAITALALSLGFAAPLLTVAQDKAAPAPVSSTELRAKIQSDKKGIVQRNLPLTDEEAKKFWPLYDAFEKDLAGPQSKANRAILDYINAGSALTDANAKRISEEVLKAQLDEAKLRQSHFARVLKVLPATKAARYMQLENKMRAVTGRAASPKRSRS